MQHLAELRNRLMVASAAVLIATVIGFFFAKDIILALEQPAHLGKPLQIISPTEGFTTYMRVALFSGIALAMPVILYEVYAYVDPALRPGERRFILLLGPFILALFVGGMAFCYFILLPQAIQFLFTFGSDVFEASPRASEYISFVTTFILGVGLVAEMPVIIFALTRIGLVSRDWLAKRRGYVLIICFIVGAIITPTPTRSTRPSFRCRCISCSSSACCCHASAEGVDARLERGLRAEVRGLVVAATGQ